MSITASSTRVFFSNGVPLNPRACGFCPSGGAGAGSGRAGCSKGTTMTAIATMAASAQAIPAAVSLCRRVHGSRSRRTVPDTTCCLCCCATCTSRQRSKATSLTSGRTSAAVLSTARDRAAVRSRSTSRSCRPRNAPPLRTLQSSRNSTESTAARYAANKASAAAGLSAARSRNVMTGVKTPSASTRARAR